MASPEKKSPSTKKKRYHLTNSDLALAATAPAHRRKGLIKAAAGDRGYPYYKGIRANLDNILYRTLGSRPDARTKLEAFVADACLGSSEIKNNQSVARGLYDYLEEHKIAAAPFDFPPVALGPAGTRSLWDPYLLKIDGRNYIPFLDFRQGRTRLTRDARRFIFSIQHTHIRLANPREYGDLGFVIFEFAARQGKVRSVSTYFDTGISFWNDSEIGTMIDAVYRVVDELLREAA